MIYTQFNKTDILEMVHKVFDEKMYAQFDGGFKQDCVEECLKLNP